jgi:tRNA A-37 threonylcarbamoyl transferase component Bud32
MAFVEIAPRYRDVLRSNGIASAGDFLGWAGVILSGHPRRHVLRVRAGDESFILKKEHRVPWRDRFASAWAGFGWSSKSLREARVLDRLRRAGVPCPEVVAAGEDGAQAFLLLREQAGMTDLRDYLGGPLPASEGRSGKWEGEAPAEPCCEYGSAGASPSQNSLPLTDSERRRLAAALGRELARIHAAGFEQPDLYAKHILVRPSAGGYRFCFLDWQRSRIRRAVPWRRRLGDLAALDASLAEHLASDRLRLVVLRSYLLDSGPLTRLIGAAIRRITERLLQRRKVRELRQPPLPGEAQQLLWLEDGERLCVARDFYEELGGRLPSWLPRDVPPSADGACVEHRLILLGAGRTAHLVQRWRRAPAGWLHRGKFPAPEFVRAAAIFRLQRFGVAGPRLLAMGYRPVGLAQRFSFLLTEAPSGVPLATFVRRSDSPGVRHELLRCLGALLRQVHEAGYTFRDGADPLEAWVVVVRERATLALAGVDALEKAAPSDRLAAAQLRRFAEAPTAELSRTDLLRVALGYLHLDRLDAGARRLLPRRERRVA